MNKRVMKTLALSLAAALILVLLPVMPTAAADGTTSWESEVTGTFDPHPTTLMEYIISTYSGGVYDTEMVTINTSATLGSKQNPYAISSEAELILFGQQTSSATTGKYYILDKADGVYDMRGARGITCCPCLRRYHIQAVVCLRRQLPFREPLSAIMP